MRENLLGVAAGDLVAALFEAHPEIQRLSLCRYCQPPTLREREALSVLEETVVERALALRGSSGLPFWDAAMAASMSSGIAPLALLDAVLLHQSHAGGEIPIARDEAPAIAIAKQLRVLPAEAQLQVLSKVLLVEGSTAHIPLVDFHCPASESNEELALEVGTRLLPDVPFFLLSSGRSYHGYWSCLLDEADFLQFLGRCLLFAPIIDRAYIAHQLLERRSALRISPKGDSDRLPYVIRVYEQ